MSEVFFEDIVAKKDGFLRGPFGGDLKKEIFVPKSEGVYKVYEQGVVLNQDQSIGRYYITKDYFDKKMSRFEVREKDFLVSCSGVNYGAIYQLRENIEHGIINQALLSACFKSVKNVENYRFCPDEREAK
jgi:type I restriction enzyme, S subunit